MHRTIDFPNLGIHLKSVGDHITVFGFDIAYYGIVIGIGILAGLMLAVMEAKRTHQNVEDYYDLDPTLSRQLRMCHALRRSVPLKVTCSQKWASPSSPGSSFRVPALIW